MDRLLWNIAVRWLCVATWEPHNLRNFAVETVITSVRISDTNLTTTTSAKGRQYMAIGTIWARLRPGTKFVVPHGGPLYQKCGHLTKGVATPSIFDIFTSFQSSIHLLACSELFYVSDFWFWTYVSRKTKKLWFFEGQKGPFRGASWPQPELLLIALQHIPDQFFLFVWDKLLFMALRQCGK